MREIKFRVWDGSLMHDVDELAFCHGNTLWSGPGVGSGSIEFDGHSLMQFTGLKDSDHKEIYEGDIVAFTYWWFDGNHAESTLMGEVVYIPDLLSFGLRGVKNKDWIRHIGGEEGSSDTAAFANWRFEGDDFHVLGNVYQHPELLREPQEKAT